ncbi:MAG TPA: type II secretion system protein [Oceanipulchritudo sp.]|nr:type II secretion system protein [Oceanipulchritudo sp.]
MNKLNTLTGNRAKAGFTLIEVIAVLVLLGILAAVAVPRYLDLTDAAEQRALDAGIAELNGREATSWANQMLLTSGNPVDATVFAGIDAGDATTNGLGADYTWSAGPTASGGTLEFGDAEAVLDRTASSDESPGRWDR